MVPLRPVGALSIGLLLVALSTFAGCIAPSGVRAIVVEESYSFDDAAPAEAASAMAFTGCLGTYEPEARRVVLAVPRALDPKFVMLLHRAETSRGPGGQPDPMAGSYVPLFSGSSGGGALAGVEAFMDERLGSGSWGHNGAFGGPELTVSYDGRGPKVDGERLRVGQTIERTETYEATAEGATFQVTRTLSAEYLGRIAYEVRDAC